LVRRARADRLLEVGDDLVRAPQHAAQVGANVEPVLTDRRQVEQRVEGRHPLDVSGVQLERARDLAHRLWREVAELLLAGVERRHDRRAGLWILRGQLLDLVEDMGRKRAQRSQSPSTASAVPMIAIMSATMWLSAILSRACRLTKDAERNFTRRGLCVPSLT